MKGIVADNNLEESSELATCTANLVNEENLEVKEKSETSPGVSRYGRTHKPKVSDDFLPTDKKVGAILGLSPKTRVSLPRDASHSSLPSPNKAVEKGRMIYELFSGGKQPSTRGRKPKIKTTNNVSPNQILKEENDQVEFQVPSDEVKSEVSTSEKIENGVEQEEMKIETPKKEGQDNEIMSPDVTSSVDDNILSENILQEASTNTTKLEDCGWAPGDLAWARVGGHPFWPCMIAMDPLTGSYTKVRRVGRGLSTMQRSLHVQFFGDNGRHSWVSTNCVIKFEGKDGLQRFAEKVSTEIKKKDKKFSTAFVIRPSSKVQWDCAVIEAEEALPKSNKERICFFEENFPPELYFDLPVIKEEKSSDEGSEVKQLQSLKRKRSDFEIDEKPTKQMKMNPELTCENIVEKKEEKEIKPVNVVQTSKKRQKRKIIDKKKPYGFSVFADKYLKHASEIHPGMSEESLQKLMVRMWDAMDENEKSVYKRERRESSKESSSGEEVASDNDRGRDDDNSSTSTRESIPFALSATPVKKASGLFRGTRLEKVCQICLKPGGTMKCKGSCLGTFHIDCIKHPPIKQEPVENEVKKRRGRQPKSLKNEPAEETERNNEINEETDHDMEKDSDENSREVCDKDENKSKFEHEIGIGSSEFKCKDCLENRTPPCFVCGLEKEQKSNSEKVRCTNGHCGKYYHLECVKAWPQASTAESNKKNTNGSKSISILDGPKTQVLTCPQHVCHTCASDDPRNATMRFNHERLVRCVLCPTAYHTGNYCVPAGSEILTGTQIICPRHYEPPLRGSHHVNAAWCFICAMVGGTLICCDLCPTSFHADCLRIATPEGGYICEDCDTGRYPLYGEVVWVKLGAYRWWPAQILFPNQIPDNVANLQHKRGEFAVRFFGSHDHYWVNRGRVFLYQEGDTGHKSVKKTSVDGLFQKALAEAAEVHKKHKVDRSIREAEARPGMKPPSYVRIKANKPVGNVRVFEVDPSSMTPCECDPESQDPCGVDSDCLNRILMVECHPSVCAAGERCGNQSFLKREYPPLEPFRTESRGWGLRALKNLQKGEFIIEYVGEMIDETEYRRRLDSKHQEKDENYYFLTIDNHRLLDAGPKGNVARFMNHSCQPNCETQKWTVNGDTRVGLFALKDIPKFEELTFNYNLECVGPDKKPCMCGAPNCSGFIGVKVSKLIEDDKKSKSDNQKTGKKKKKRQLTKISEGDCFECGGGGELLLCDNKTCPKGYHLNCAKLKKWPQGKWLCPWHFCDICKRRTGKRCGFCPKSYCVLHADGNIRLNSTLGMVCREHDEDSGNNDAYNEILEDVKICLEGIKRNDNNKEEEEEEEDDDEFDNNMHDNSSQSSILETKSDSENTMQDNCPSTESKEPSSESEECIAERRTYITNSDVTPVMKVSKSSPTPISPQERSGILGMEDGATLPKKKRGRPRKYPLSPPTTARYANKIKDSQKKEIKTHDSSTGKRKVGRPRKKRSVDIPVQHSSPPVKTESSESLSPFSDSILNSSLELVSQEKTNEQNMPLLSPNSSRDSFTSTDVLISSGKVSKMETNNDSLNLHPRTSSRKRQPSEKLAAFMISQSKSAKKRMNKCLEAFSASVVEIETHDETLHETIQETPRRKMYKSPKNVKTEMSPKEVCNFSSPKSSAGKSKVTENIHTPQTQASRIQKNSSVKSKKNTLNKIEVCKSLDLQDCNTKHAKSDKSSSPKVMKSMPDKIAKKHLHAKDKIVAGKCSTSSATKVSKEELFLKSYLKRLPKKTILQRVDHKPDVNKTSPQVGNKLGSPSNSITPKHNVQTTAEKTAHNVAMSKINGQSMYEKSDVNGINGLGPGGEILDSFDDTESQYFMDNVTTIPIKCSEFEQPKDEFLMKNISPAVETIETTTNVESEFTPLSNEECTEKLTEDGKYQILTNMRPDSLDMEKDCSMLLGVDS